MINICYVCTGNTCRSIMAERLMKKALKERQIQDVKVISRGIFAKKENITQQAQSALKKLKASASNRKSIKLGKIQKDILYVVMTEQMKTYVKTDKILTMKQLLGYDIQDPYGQAEDVYLDVANDIIKANEIILEKIIKVC
mgnify:FL=1